MMSLRMTRGPIKRKKVEIIKRVEVEGKGNSRKKRYVD